MLFNSIDFLIFFPIVTFLYFLIPHKFRWFLLLTASCVFYMAFIPVYILILAVTIIIDYTAGILIEKSAGYKKKMYLIVSIISTCMVLFIFKYFDFFTNNFNAITSFFHWNYSLNLLKIILPIGLSFHTFQSLSYVIEVYRGNQKAEYNFGIYSLYVMFYPQLVAGPIERPQNLLHQFREKHKFDYRRVTDGLKLMAWGMFKKVVIADRLAEFVNPVYNDPTQYQGLPLIIATVFFAFQIYCDFSGYSDIAIGSAQVMGFKLMKNFDRPYFSKSISEFWKRWHISLSTWFRDYLYISLGGSRVVKWRWYFNLFITFLISGLWHGANWTFVIWGGLHGFYLIFAILSEKYRTVFNKLIGIDHRIWFKKITQVLIVFILVDFSWIFFRANKVDDAFYVIKNLFVNINHVFEQKYFLTTINSMGSIYNFILSVCGIFVLLIIHWLQRNKSLRIYIAAKPLWIRWSAYYFVIIFILIFGVFNNSQFIYFQF